MTMNVDILIVIFIALLSVDCHGGEIVELTF